MSQEIKDKCVAIIEKLEIANKRESAVGKEQADDYAGMKMVEIRQDNLIPLPEDCEFNNYGEVVDKFTADLARGNGELSKIENNKVEIEALQYYVDNN